MHHVICGFVTTSNTFQCHYNHCYYSTPAFKQRGITGSGFFKKFKLLLLCICHDGKQYTSCVAEHFFQVKRCLLTHTHTLSDQMYGVGSHPGHLSSSAQNVPDWTSSAQVRVSDIQYIINLSLSLSLSQPSLFLHLSFPAAVSPFMYL